jgi:hypothetical protein
MPSERQISEKLHRDLGRLEARIDAIEVCLAHIKPKIEQVADTLNQAKGGWKMLVVLAGISGAIGALLAKIPVLFLIGGK